MITIMKSKMKFQFDNSDFVTSQDTPDGLYFKFRDGSELMMHAEKTPQLQTIPMILMKSTANNIIIDLDKTDGMISIN